MFCLEPTGQTVPVVGVLILGSQTSDAMSAARGPTMKLERGIADAERATAREVKTTVNFIVKMWVCGVNEWWYV